MVDDVNPPSCVTGWLLRRGNRDAYPMMGCGDSGQPPDESAPS
jgi:hypothetical protein